MFLKAATSLCKTISAYWYAINQGIQIYDKWFNENKLSNQTKPYINYIYSNKNS